MLVNNENASKQVPFLETSPEDLALPMDTGFYPTWYLMQAAIPYLRKTRGSIPSAPNRSNTYNKASIVFVNRLSWGRQIW